MAYVIAILNQKGGAGKSTLATNLSTAYARRGKQVLLADADPQGSARNWRAASPDPGEHGKAFPDVVGADTAEAVETVTESEVMGAFDVVVVDGPPGVSGSGPGKVTVAVLKAADLVLIPVRPSGADLWATADLAELTKARQDATGTPDAAFIVTQADSRTNVAEEIGSRLEELGLPVLQARCGDRVTYVKALGQGVAVEDVKPSGKAAEEIEAIIGEINRRFYG